MDTIKIRFECAESLASSYSDVELLELSVKALRNPEILPGLTLKTVGKMVPAGLNEVELSTLESIFKLSHVDANFDIVGWNILPKGYTNLVKQLVPLVLAALGEVCQEILNDRFIR